MFIFTYLLSANKLIKAYTRKTFELSGTFWSAKFWKTNWFLFSEICGLLLANIWDHPVFSKFTDQALLENLTIFL